jgi:DHA2 family multidrug resistance protein
MFFAAPIAGRLSKSVDLRVMLAFGLLSFGFSAWWLAHLTSQSSFWDMLWPQCLRGFSMIFLFLPVNQLSLGTLPPAAVKNAAGLYNLMRNLGGAFGLAAIGTIATTRTAIHTLHLQEQVTYSRPGAMLVLQDMTLAMTPAKEGNAHLAALRRMAMMVEREALTLAYNDILLLMALCFVLAMPLTLLLARPKAATGFRATPHRVI